MYLYLFVYTNIFLNSQETCPMLLASDRICSCALQCVAARSCCSVLQRTRPAVCCSMLQCVAVCCSVSHRHDMCDTPV